MSKHRDARRLIWPLVVAVLAGGVGVGWYFNQPSGSPLHYETAAVTRGRRKSRDAPPRNAKTCGGLLLFLQAVQ